MPAAKRKAFSDGLAEAGLSKREIAAHKGEYALIGAGVVDSFHRSNREALMEACRKYLNSQFSIRKVGAKTV